MIDLECFIHQLNIKWIKRALTKKSMWSTLTFLYDESEEFADFLKYGTNYAKQNVITDNPFWRDVTKAVIKLAGSYQPHMMSEEEILSESLRYNVHFKNKNMHIKN